MAAEAVTSAVTLLIVDCRLPMDWRDELIGNRQLEIGNDSTRRYPVIDLITLSPLTISESRPTILELQLNQALEV